MTHATENGRPACRIPRPTVNDLAQAKNLPVDFLQGLGLHDLPEGGVGIPYYDPAGVELFVRERRALEGKWRFHQPSGVSLQPYGQWRLQEAYKAGFLIIPEGESDCWVLWYHKFSALGLPGCGSAKSLHRKHIDASIRRIYLNREPGEGGDAFVEKVPDRLRELKYAGEVYELRLPDGIKDPADLHIRNRDQFASILKAAMDASVLLDLTHRSGGRAGEGIARSGAATRERSPTQAELLFGLAGKGEYFHSPDNKAFATVAVGSGENGLETLPVRGRDFRNWLIHRFFQATGKAPSVKTFQDVLGTLEARAQFEGPCYDVFCRVGGDGGSIYLNLCDDRRGAVAITPVGWRLVDRVPVRFRRTRGMLPLPEPVRGGTIEDLRPFVNALDEHWPLVVGWLVQAFRPKGPYPILCLSGEQGSAKSTTARVLRSLVDPNAAPLRSEPRDERDLMIAASNSWLVAMDNLSHLPLWLSDALCRLSTGGGFATRELYTDSDEIIFDAQRPVLINGIEDLATRPDLMDRSIVLQLPRIGDDKRMPEEEFWQNFEVFRPRILGALLDAVSGALAHINDVRLECFPRMADFARWATAAERHLGWPERKFLDAYQANRAEGSCLTLEASVLYPILQEFVGQATESWIGTCGSLLEELTKRAGDRAKAKGWPSSPRGLSGMLRRLAPSLRACGICVEFKRAEGGKRVRQVTIGVEKRGS